jgi:DNA-binding response OmpR family regulator
MRILLVEDEPNAAQMLAKGLRKQTYAVDVARDGQEAVHQASVNDYDLIILDVMLPLKDGFEVCGDLRAGGSSVPILMLTARDTAFSSLLLQRRNQGPKTAFASPLIASPRRQ